MRKLLCLTVLIVGLTLALIGCNHKTEQTDSDNDSTSTSDSSDTNDEETQPSGDDSEDNDASTDSSDTIAASTDSSGSVDKSNLTCISDFSDYWDNYYSKNEAAINSYEGMPYMEWVSPATAFIIGIQYDLLNLYNEDGRFEGELLLAGHSGFVEKKGKQLTFGYEDVLEENGFSPSMVKGDKIVSNGSCDLEKGYYFSDSYTERDGSIIERSVSELQIEEDGSISTFELDGSTLNYNGEESITNTFVFVRNGDNRYDYVIAKAQVGTGFDLIHLENDMTKEKAITTFEAAGFTIEATGGIKDGVITVD